MEFINFFERDLISDDSDFCSLILSGINLQCHVFFPFENLLFKVRLCLLTAFLMTSDMTSSPRRPNDVEVLE